MGRPPVGENSGNRSDPRGNGSRAVERSGRAVHSVSPFTVPFGSRKVGKNGWPARPGKVDNPGDRAGSGAGSGVTEGRDSRSSGLAKRRNRGREVRSFGRNLAGARCSRETVRFWLIDRPRNPGMMGRGSRSSPDCTVNRSSSLLVFRQPYPNCPAGQCERRRRAGQMC